MRKKKPAYLAIVGFLGISLIGLLWYLFSVRSYHFQIPTRFTAANTPYTEVEIEGKAYLLEVDLGSKFPLSLEKNALEQIDKKMPNGFRE
jgi:hypothetical protein